MAINLDDPQALTQLQEAVYRSYEHQSSARDMRRLLIDKYQDVPDQFFSDPDGDDVTTLVNMFQNFVRGHTMTLAFNAPRWSVRARTMQAKGFDFQIKTLLNAYNDYLNMQELCELWALDSAFGDCHAKVVTGIAPRGVYSRVAPRVYRLSPDNVIYDQSAAHKDEVLWIGDIYLVARAEAVGYYTARGADPEAIAGLTEWRETASESMLPDGLDTDALAEDMVRLIDIYFPATNEIVTWPCNGDRFQEIDGPWLEKRRTPINPYESMKSTMIPDTLTEIALLETLMPQHDIANFLLLKAVKQARDSKRNPVFETGYDEEMQHLLDTEDGEGVGVDDLSKFGLYVLPGPDPSIIQLGQMSMAWFSQFGGNLETALGQSAGADTARQTQAMLQQITTAQSITRTKFERFLANIGKKIATLAFEDEAFALDIMVPIPGTKVSLNLGWSPGPRPASIDDFHFEVVPLSTSYRTPEQHLAQLDAGSTLFLKYMQVAAMGAPINLAAVMKSISEAFDLVPDMAEWWSGEEAKPSPQEQTANTYASLADKSGSQRTISYQGSGGGGSQQALPAPQMPSGMNRMGGVQ